MRPHTPNNTYHRSVTQSCLVSIVDKQSNMVECGSVYWLHGFSVLQNTKRPAYGGSHTVASLNNAPADGALEIPRVLV